MEVNEKLAPDARTGSKASSSEVSLNAISRQTGEGTLEAVTRIRSCTLIGSTTLAIYCTEQVLAAGHQVRSVVAVDHVFRTWAEKEGIRHQSLTQLEAELEEDPVDWLFSVVNPAILSTVLIKRVRIGAFNYHDSPLPRYAGTHATSWALIARETEYAVSWHTVTSTIDAGQIVVQEPVPIDSYDTALSLNLKCFQAAKNGFRKLLLRLEKGKLSARDQDLSRRSFYRKTRRPDAGGCLEWTQTAEISSATVRALDFGELYPNPLTRAKLILTQDVVQINHLWCLEQRSETTPGTLIEIGPRGWRVTTKSNDVCISDFATLEGEPIEPETLAHNCALQVGQQLPTLMGKDARNIRETLETLAPYEQFWHDRLALAQPIQLPYERISKSDMPQWEMAGWYEPLNQCDEKNPGYTVLGAFVIYLARLTGQSQLQIGWNIPAITLNGSLASMMLATTVPMVCEIDWDNSFADTVKFIREEIKEVEEKKTYPRDLISRYPSLRVKSELKRPWRIAVAMVENFTDVEAIGELLTLRIDSLGRFRWIYDSRYLNRDIIDRMNDHLRELARAAVSDTLASVARLNLLPKIERELLVKTWNETQNTYPDGSCIHCLFEERVDKAPNATAVVFKDEKLSYVELNTRANQLAHKLIDHGVAAGNYVVTLLERSITLVVAQLAILKAGAAYVPLDPAVPRERHRWIINDCSARFLITDGELEKSDVPVLQLRENDLERLARTNPGLSSSSLNVACVMYTSGSTGTPKGVLVPHRAIVNLVVNNAYAVIGSDDRVAFAANPAFDASTFEMWSPLLGGGTLVIIDRETALNTQLFHRTLQTEKINILWMTVSLFIQFVGELTDVFSQLDMMLIGGDTLSASIINAVPSSKRPKRLINMYGVTETTTFATSFTIGEISDEHCSIPIGQPIANTRIYLLDARRELVPCGAIGEIYIGGAGVACGYLNRPDLTAERFVPDPFVKEPNARMYKTGDLARHLPDGNLIFLGRNDHQVKIRGFRVEVREIEVKLSEHPAVRQAVVVAMGTADKRLVAYVVAKSEISAKNLREHLAQNLPDYMLPTAFVQLDTLPLTLTGKLNRRALPAPDLESLAHARYETPIGQIETLLAEIWSSLLGVSQIGRRDSFFALGGHSLLAVRLKTQIASLGVDLPLSTLFSSPILADLAAAIQKDSARGLFLPPPITAISRQGALPLSFAQQRLWFLTQLENVSDAYHIPFALRLRGLLNVHALQQALHTFWSRHEALRSVFISSDGKPEVHLLSADLGIPLRIIVSDASNIDTLCIQEAHSSFNLVSGPLIRALLIQVTNDVHVILLTLHHIIMDGWSFDVLLNELGSLYSAYRNLEFNPLPPLCIQYPDYAAWQRQWLVGAVLHKQMEYWKDHLADAPVWLEIPTDRPRAAEQSFVGEFVAIELDPQLTLNLKFLSREHDVTVFMILLAAWAAVLSRLSGQDEVVIGVPSANRAHQDLESLIGFFVNTLAIRCDLRQLPTVAELLARIKTSTVQAQAHQDLPFEQVVDIVNPPRRLGCGPVCQVMFAWQNLKKKHWSWPNLDVTSIKCPYNMVKFDLELDLEEMNDHIAGQLRYATALFDKKTAERQANYFKNMLRAMTRETSLPVGRIDILDPCERELLLQTWNNTQTPYPDQACIHHLFEQQVEKTPDAIAVRFAEEKLSYAELNARANRLAHFLTELGVVSGNYIVTLLDRSIELIVAQLAILKAGAAYVPLDPQTPAERHAVIVADCCASLLITGDRPTNLCTLTLNLKEIDLQEGSPLNLNLPASSFDIAYVMYTSGSTGIPKGVLVLHRGIVRFIVNDTYVHVRSNDRIAFVANPAFDASIFEVWGALVNGATLVIFDRDTVLNLDKFCRSLQEERVTILSVSAGIFDHIMTEYADTFPKLDTLVVGGDTLSPRSINTVLSRAPPKLFVNAYGPTESTIVATSYRIIDKSHRYKSIPIGRPISNTRIYLLNSCREPVPLGSVGEIYIGGAGVARGYLMRPDLSEERFLADPFTNEPDARMYKTGDLARYLNDGNLVFLGRNDRQVKLRGFRIEPGEIEARLAEHPTVREAVVVAQGDSDKRLIAYLVGDEIEPAALRKYLSAYFPDYMIPAAFVQLDEFALTPSGKLDRRTLPMPDITAFALTNYEPPTGSNEITVAKIWQDLLGIDQISRHDSFFALGGHSLLAVRMNSRIASLGFHLPLATVLLTPTLAALAAAMESSGESDNVGYPPIITGDRMDPLPLSFAQRRLWFLARHGGVSIAYHIPIALRLEGQLDIHALQLAFNTLWIRHEALRSVFVSVNGEPEVRLLDGKQGLPLRLIDLKDTNKLTTVCSEEAHSPFDLGSGPLVRTVLIRINDDLHILLVTQHHIVSDGWSVRVLMLELSRLYRAFHNHQPVPLPLLPIGYPDYAIWQHKWFSDKRMQQHADYWRKTFEHAPVLLDLRTDHPRPARQSFIGNSLPIELAADLTLALKNLSQRYGVTLFTTLLTAWSAVLSRLSGQDEIVIGIASANRRRCEVESLIGFFVNTLPLRVDLRDRPSVAELLAQVRDSTVQAQSHQDLPFDKIVEIVQPPRRLDHTPLFQVTFAWQTNATVSWSWPSLDVSLVKSEYHAVKYDLELSLTEHDNRITGTLGYASALFKENTIVRYSRYLKKMLMVMAKKAHFPIAKIDILDAPERQLVLETWNNTPTPYLKHSCIHHLFEQQAVDTPNSIAVVFENKPLTYKQLNKQANQLAHRLIKLGVEPNARVAICVERSATMIIGFLAILKAGGAYVPLDPTYGSERLRHILVDAESDVVLADKTGQLILGEAVLASRHVLDPNASSCCSDLNPIVPTLNSRHLAYVIYTSGSTGKPKGVMVEHGSLVNLAQDEIARFEAHTGSRILQFAAFCFDASIFEIVMALSSGASLYIASDIERQDQNCLLNYIQQHAISHVTLPPVVLQSLKNKLRQIRSLTIILAGEAPNATLLHELLDQNVVYNAYGLTESTVCATIWKCPAEFTGKTVPIGRPISNTLTYVLDSYCQLVPPGAVGELYIGGDAVARGYLNRSDLNSERFVPNPFAGSPNSRMFKTGDLAYYLPDGNLVLLGRSDQQVKIHGCRIELGEIESILLANPHVLEAAVVAIEEPYKRLVAYVASGDIAPMDLRVYLSTRLPDFMIPTVIMRIDKLPITLNGKLDRGALPPPNDDVLFHATYEVPIGALETTLAEIWRLILRVERVSRFDSFFALGGHSLLAVEMIELLRQRDLSLSVRDLFETPMLATLARTLRERNEIPVPQNRITRDTSIITPEQLPLIELNQSDIDRIVECVPGGITNIQDIYALSPLQEGILFHHILSTERDPYLLITQSTFVERQTLNRYLAAVQEVVNRHDILRTAFIWKDISMPAQVVWREATLSITELPLDTEDRLISMQPNQQFDVRHYRMDLSQAPLIHFAIKYDENNHRWNLLTLLHHLIGDHTTLDIMRTEVQAFLNARGHTLPPSQPFRNLIAQARLGTSVEMHESFFKEMLADVIEPTLPFGLADVQLDGSQMSEIHRMLPAELNGKLRSLAKGLNVNLASLCHVAWAQVLSLISGQRHVVFGTVLLGRMQLGEASDRAMGLFVNTLPIRINLDKITIVESIQETHIRLARLLEHEHASLILAQKCSGVPAETPLFSALLNYRHVVTSMMVNGTVSDDDMEFVDAQERTNYPLTLSIEDFGEALGITVQSQSPIEPQRVAAYVEEVLVNLAEALERTPHLPACELQVLPESERQLLLKTWNDTQTPYSDQVCIHELFERQVECTPKASAILFQEEQISYEQLNARANGLGKQLRDFYVGPEMLVAICADRSTEMVVGLLAILKAGATYVPLDPGYPQKRLADILADANPAVVLMDETGKRSLSNVALGCIVLDLNGGFAKLEANLCVSDLEPQNLAYVMYTSGSTGAPKGVQIEHRAVINRLEWMQRAIPLASNDRVLQKTPFTFDVSVWEIFWTLLNGSTLIIADPGDHQDPNALAGLISQKHATTVHFVPSMLTLFLNVIRSEDCSTLRRIICSGETLSAATVQLCRDRMPWVELFNMYGPTEATIDVTSWKCPTDFTYDYVPIGRPISNTSIYLLNYWQQPLPLGAIGEIWIGGIGVARGYLNRPDLSAKSFVPDPFMGDQTARMYKTGDLARYLPDGNLMFLGRNDSQVKIRGFRIELSEIESVLARHPLVREAVVTMNKKLEERLIAYVVADEIEPVSLREYLSAFLPDYMIPSAFIRLDALPRTSSGKLDYRALSTPDNHSIARAVYDAPVGQMETILMEIWRELTGVDQISRHDSFFALGGHSLLAVQMIEKLRRKDLALSIRDLFQSPVLRILARNLTKRKEVPVPPNQISPEIDSITPELLPLINLTQFDIDRIVERVPGGIANIQDIYALSPLQDGILFHHMLHTDSDPYLLTSQMAFNESNALTSYLTAVQRVINRHDILRTAIIWKDISVPAQVVCRKATLSITELTLKPEDGPISAQLNDQFDPRRFRMNLARAPLLRFVVTHDESNNRWILLTLLHHLIGDHTTLDIMHEEVQAFLKNSGDALPAAEPFRNLIAQAQLGITVEKHECFFKDMLMTVTEPTLPFGLSNVHGDGSRISEMHQMLSAGLNDSLRQQAKRLDVSLASLCHVAWAQVLSRTSGQEHVVFGTVLFGRMQSGNGSDRTMGLFINTLPIRVDVNESTIIESIRMTHHRLAELLEHEHASLALAQKCSGVPAGVPLFSALLNYRHNVMPKYENVMNMEILEVHERTNYPLTLSVEDVAHGLGITVQVQSPIAPERVCRYMEEALVSMAKALEHTPGILTRELPILPATERDFLLKTLNDTDISYPDCVCIHQLFELQVERTPNAMAMLFEDERITYKQLNLRANKLAHQLREHCGMLDVLVAICVEPSSAMIVSILAVLKAGAHYVPLDTKYADKRLSHVVIDAKPVLILADIAGKKVLGDAGLAHAVLDPNDEFAQPDTNPQVPGLTSRHLAYVVYTSGSTGAPKGVMIEHRSIVNYALYAVEHYEIAGAEGSVIASSIAFDLCLTAVFPVLICGRTVRLPSNNTDFAWRETILRSNDLSPVKLTPSHLTMVQDASIFQTLSKHIHTLVLGGEVLNYSSLGSWFKHAPITRIFNEYGPAETTVGCTVHKVERSSVENEIVPIGRPISNTRIYLLDAYGQPVPLGVIGELYIGGHGVARGYLNRPELTAERFLQDPFVNDSDARMYRTGDLARYLPDGTLIFLGRNDNQIKIRGFRVELGEIEAILREHPAVGETAVVAFGDSNKRLIAYVLGNHIDFAVLRDYLRPRLPEHMLPSSFIRLDAFPLTPNGKIDRDALPPPSGDDAFDRAAYEAPAGPIEIVLAEIWSELLEVQRVGRRDSFFALGGHSLLAVKMVQRATSCGLPCSLNELFEVPQLAGFAARLTPTSLSKDYTRAIPVRSSGSELPLFFVPTGLGDHSYVFSLARHIHAKYPVYALPWPSIDESSPHTIEVLAEKIITFIKAVQPEGPYRIAGYSAGGILAYAVAQFFSRLGETVGFVGFIDVLPPHVLRNLPTKHLFFDYLAQNTSPENLNDARRQFEKIDFRNLAHDAENMSLVGANLPHEFVALAWKRISIFTQAASSYEPISLPVNVYQFHSTETLTLSCIHDEYKNLLNFDVTNEWNNILRPGKVTSIPIPGNHWTIMSDMKNRMHLGDELTRALESA